MLTEQPYTIMSKSAPTACVTSSSMTSSGRARDVKSSNQISSNHSEEQIDKELMRCRRGSPGESLQNDLCGTQGQDKVTLRHRSSEPVTGRENMSKPQHLQVYDHIPPGMTTDR